MSAAFPVGVPRSLNSLFPKLRRHHASIPFLTPHSQLITKSCLFCHLETIHFLPHYHHLTQATIVLHLNYCSHLLIGYLASTFVHIQSILHVAPSNQGSHRMQVSQGKLGPSDFYQAQNAGQ